MGKYVMYAGQHDNDLDLKHTIVQVHDRVLSINSLVHMHKNT